MKWRSAIGERGQRRVALEPEKVLDRGVRRAFEAAMSEHVGSDLGEGALKEHHVGVVDGAAGPLAQAMDRVVERVERVIKARQSGVKLKRRRKLRSQ